MDIEARQFNSDNHETLQIHANYFHSIYDASTAVRRCKSESDIRAIRRERREIDKCGMGMKVSRRSQSASSVTAAEYEPLGRINFLVNCDEYEAAADDDYELLASSSEEGIELSELNADNNNDHPSHDNGHSCSIMATNDDTRQLNVTDVAVSSGDCAGAAVITKFSTLPRLKSRDSDTRRHSCKTAVSSERQKTAAAVVDDKPTTTFASTTLPKARSRMGDSLLQFRHSMRHSIVGRRAKYMSEPSGSNNGTIIATAAGESTSGTDGGGRARAKRSRSNLSWLRKSMKKLNPFQMPPHESETTTTALSIVANNNGHSSDDVIPTPPPPSPPSTSHEINSSSECEKEALEDVSESRSPAVSNNSAHVVDISENPDVLNTVLLEQQPHQAEDDSRPRQYGRRSNPIRIASIAADSVNHAAARIIAHHQQERPSSAPVNRAPSQRNGHRPRQSLPSEQSSLASSRNSSPVSMVSSTGSSSIPDVINSINDIRPRFTTAPNTGNSTEEDEREQQESASESKVTWPHLVSRPICCVFCTLGLFNISRFAIFSVHFGANFLVQFLLLSFIFGIPFLWLQIVLGSRIQGGIVTMFKITPICKGIGISLMVTHCIISLYSSTSIAWVLIYLRDSLISSDEQYLWVARFDAYRGYQNITALRFSENIADYFNGVVLQRLSGITTATSTHDGKMRFQLAFNVSLVWIIVFVILCRGIKSLGKILIGMCLFCFLSLTAVCIKFLTLLNFESVQDIFPATDWQEFFANSNSWSVAAQEVFLTWGLLGVSTYSLYCKSGKSSSSSSSRTPNNAILRREALLIVFLTLFGLFLGGILGSTCIIILKLNGYNYFPASFENPKNDIFLWPMHYASMPNFHHSIPSKWITRYSNVIGESFERPIFVNQQGKQVYKESGYKPIRLVTEILPATLAISPRIEPVWGVLIFLCLLLFGVGQLSVMWKTISGAIGNSTSAILLSCVTGLFLGVPLTTENAIVIVHFMDYVFGGSWFIPILWTAYLLAIFLVRGSPYSSDFLVKELRLTETLSAFVAFSWNVLLPVGFLLLSVMEYKKSHSTELFHQRNILSLSHMSSWPLWVKQVGGLLQVSLLILLPCVALVQIYIYLSRGPRDILERIERLFRPPLDGGDSSFSHHTPIRRLCQTNLSPSQSLAVAPMIQENGVNNLQNTLNDAPPKYSPPPSYGKAMGLRVAKVLRNSIRRSMRRLRRRSDLQPQMDIPTISSTVVVDPRPDGQSSGQGFNNFIRSSIRRLARNSQSNEQLVLTDMTTDYHVV